ncbi:hypothetical protein AVEN_106659-1 [Araneus ventricosus]|uniref:Uncharacterized protein n=1 Tax=Araneus ventricosus TaxID=182803 RepID=A0A4Y2RQ06_ARAVE|nr:hypothetical protein AVEN_106659-1 [Araneus ventricosus]
MLTVTPLRSHSVTNRNSFSSLLTSAAPDQGLFCDHRSNSLRQIENSFGIAFILHLCFSTGPEAYSAQIWGLTANTRRKKIETPQNKILRIMTNASWFMRNEIIPND